MCINSKVDAVRNAEWEIIPRKKGEKVPESELDEPQTFLEGLSSNETFDVCLAKMIPDLELYDCGTMLNVFPRGSFDDNGYLLEDPGQPVDMHVIDGRSVLIEAPPVGGRTRRFWQYSWMSPSSIPTPLDVREVMYLMNRPSSRGVYGTSVLEQIQYTVNYLLDSTLANSKYYENGMHIGGQIDHPDVTAVDELKLRAKMYKQELQGPMRYNKWLVTGGNVKITPLQFTPQQMQYLDSQKWYAKVVMGMFKISPSELGFTEDLNRATGIQQSITHKSRAIWPLMTLIEASINQKLIWPFFSDRVKFQFKRSLDFEDQIKQLEVYQRRVDGGFWSINQVKDDMGEDKWPDKEYDKPFAMASLGMAGGFGFGGDTKNKNKNKNGKTDIFARQGQGKEQYGSGEGESKGRVTKAVNAESQSGEPGFAFIPRVWDGQKIEGVTDRNKDDMTRYIWEASDADKKRIREELKRMYSQESTTPE